MQNNNIFATGLTLNFYESADFEQESGKNIEKDNLIKARNLLRVLMMGWNSNWQSLNSWQTFFAVFLERDHELTLAMRRGFQQGFQHVFEQLKNSELNEQQHQQALLFISNCMAFLPFADMTPHEFISIPQYVDSAWQLIEYKVTPIELTPTSGFQKLFLADHDRVFAYGLEPISQLMAEPHLIFMGTTYPAGQGFATTVETDLEAFETAGKKLYRTGHKNITNWLQKQTNKVHVCGTSLGGALSLLVAIDQGDKLSRVDALNPPGLYDPWRKSRFDHWDELTEKPAVFIQKQGNDPVSRFGVWKSDWHVLQVNPPDDKQGPNQITDHALNYAGFAETKFLTIDAQLDNQNRKWLNLLLYTMLRSAFYYSIVVPFRYLFVPLYRFINSHKIQLLLTFILATILNANPVLLAIINFPLTANLLLPAIVISYLMTELAYYIRDKVAGKKESDVSRFLHWLSDNPALNLGVELIALAFIGTFSASFWLFPATTPLFIFSIATAPLVLCLLNKTKEIIATLFGYNDDKHPKYQDPYLRRNRGMDIESNFIEITLTESQLEHYCMIKSKQDVAPSEPIKSSSPSVGSNLISFFAPKSKAHDINHTLQRHNPFGKKPSKSDAEQQIPLEPAP